MATRRIRVRTAVAEERVLMAPRVLFRAIDIVIQGSQSASSYEQPSRHVPLAGSDRATLRAGEQPQVRLNHLMDQFLKFYLARPPKLPPGFGGIPQQRFHIGRPEELGIDDHMVVVVEAQTREGGLDELPHRVLLPGRDHVVFRFVLLKHQPHRADVLAGMPPVTSGLQIAEPQLLRQAELDSRGMGGNLPGDELEATTGGLVIIQDAGGGFDAVGLPVVASQVKPGHFRDPVSGPRMKRRQFVLGHLRDLSEHLVRGGKIETAVRGTVPERGQDMVRPVDVRIERREFVLERIRDEALRRQVVALVWLDRLKDPVDARKAFQRGGVELQPILEMQNAPEPMLWVLDRHPSNKAVYLVPFLQ